MKPLQVPLLGMLQTRPLGATQATDGRYGQGKSAFAQMKKYKGRPRDRQPVLDDDPIPDVAPSTYRGAVFLADAAATPRNAPAGPELAERWLRWTSRRLGLNVTTDPSRAEAILLTMPAAAGAIGVPRALKRIKVQPDRLARKAAAGPFVIVGGSAGWAPAAFDRWADFVCVGEGWNFLRTLSALGPLALFDLPEAWIPGQPRDVIPSDAYSWEFPPARIPSGAVALVASRGCPRRCLFCSQGWGQTWRARAALELAAQVGDLSSCYRDVRLVTNDAAALGLDRFLGRHVSATFAQVERATDAQLAGLRTIRFGVEGVSERLRAAVGKPITDARLWATTERLLKLGKAVRWFLICGLPGETFEDYAPLREHVRRVAKLAARAKIQPIGLSFTAFLPEPSTPLAWLPLVDDYGANLGAFVEWFFSVAQTSRVQILKPASTKGRLQRALAIMACSEADLRRGWSVAQLPGWRVRYPWRDQTFRAALAYCRRLGLATPPACFDPFPGALR